MRFQRHITQIVAGVAVYANDAASMNETAEDAVRDSRHKLLDPGEFASTVQGR